MTVRPIDANELHAVISAWPESIMYKDWVQSAIAYAPTLTPSNEPLTLDELEELSQTYTNWVWLVFLTVPQEENCWERACKAYALHERRLYGKTWLAYRRPPEGEED